MVRNLSILLLLIRLNCLNRLNLSHVQHWLLPTIRSMLWLLPMMLLSLQAKASGVPTCDDLFGGGLQGTVSGSTLSIKPNAQIIDAGYTHNFDIIKNNGTTNNCTNNSTSDSCSVSGDHGINLFLEPFKYSSKSNHIHVQTNNRTIGGGASPPRDWGKFTLQNNKNLTIKTQNRDLYVINSITVNRNSTLFLHPGTYWINDLRINSGGKFVIASDGVVTLNVNKFNQDGDFNTPAVANREVQLIVHNETNKTIIFNAQGETTAIIYVDGDVRLNSNAIVRGFLAAENVDMNSNAKFYGEPPTINGGLCTVDPPPVAVEHYLLTYSSAATSCSVNQINVKACANAACSVVANQPSTVDLSYTLNGTSINLADDVLIPANAATGVNVTIPSQVIGSLSWAVADQNPIASGGYQCANSATCQMTISDGLSLQWTYGSGGQTSIPGQIAEAPFSDALTLTVNSSCPGYTPVEPLEIGYECVSPAVCSSKTLTVNGNVIPATHLGGTVSYGSVVANYDVNNPTALSPVQFNDAGSIRLHARLGNTEVPSNDFYVRPTQLRLTADAIALDANDPIKYPTTTPPIAGVDYQLSLYAVGAIGQLNPVLANRLPNYRAQSVSLNANRTLPANGVHGRLTFSNSNVAGSSSFVSGSGYQPVSVGLLNMDEGQDGSLGLTEHWQMRYHEVGGISLTARDNYDGVAIDSQDLALGSYLPAYLDATDNSPQLSNACTNFSYIGQPIPLSIDPVVTVSAHNQLGEVTQNYDSTAADGGFWQYFPVTSDVLAADLSGYAGSAQFSVSGIAVTDAEDYDGARDYQLVTPKVTYVKTMPPVVPFNGSIAVSLAVSASHTNYNLLYYPNGISGSSAASHTMTPIDGTELRWGRVRFDNVYGSPSSDLRVPIITETYRNFGGFAKELEDSCHQYNWTTDGGVLTYASTITGYAPSSILQGLGNIVAGRSLSNQGIIVPSPTANAEGEIILYLNFPGTGMDYMNFDWDGSGVIDIDDKPSADIQFGQYRGNDRIINRREGF